MLLFLALVAAAAGGGYAVLVTIGLDDREALVGGPVVGLVAATLPAWWLGWAGLTAWRLVLLTLLLAGAGVGSWMMWQRRQHWRQLAWAAAVLAAGILGVLLLRLDRGAILGTEKPMDLGILATLLRTQSFPPEDMWLAGEALPYYYFGALLWSGVLGLSRLPLEVGYNLVVALVGGLVFACAWMLGQRLGGNRLSGLAAAFFCLFAGTPDGLRQVLGGVRFADMDFWQSSRQIHDTITEFPLFTAWLGDLHPHYLSMPIMCCGLLVAAAAAHHRRWASAPTVLVLAALFGATWAANPWAMPPTLAAMGLLLLSGDGCWSWARGRFLAVAAVAVGGAVLTAPFQLEFRPPLQGLGLVRVATALPELLLWGGCLLVPLLWVAGTILWRGFEGDHTMRLVQPLLVLAVVVVVAAVSRRPTLVFLLAAVWALAARALSASRECDRERPSYALAALGLLLLAVPEALYVRDPYGGDLHRMNTVFKAYIQAWPMLALALPVVVRRCVSSRWLRAVVWLVLVLVALPHLVGMALAPPTSDGLDGLQWMDAGDRAMVRALRSEPPGTVLVEAVGDPYSEFARLSVASGVPAVLGWANHESVWRGGSIVPETARRAELVQRIYGSGEVAAVRAAVAEAGANLVAVGRLERRTYPAEGLQAVRAAGEVVLEEGGAFLVRFSQPSAAGGG
jgi:YYY domain-containing protein